MGAKKKNVDYLVFSAGTYRLNRNFEWKSISYVLLTILQIQTFFPCIFHVGLQLLLAFWQFPVSLPCQPLSFWGKLLTLFTRIPAKTSQRACPACVPCWAESFYAVLLLMLLVSTSCRLQVKTKKWTCELPCFHRVSISSDLKWILGTS